MTSSQPTHSAPLSPTRPQLLTGARQRIRPASSPPTQSEQPSDAQAPQPIALGLLGTAALYLTLLLTTAAAWVVTARQARHTGMNGMATAGTMGLGTAAFIGMWLAMVVAMMFPTVGPTAVLWSRRTGAPTDGSARRNVRIVAFLAVYLLIWSAFGLLLYEAAAGLTTITHVSAQDDWWIATTVYAVAGVYQLTPAKTRCRVRCVSPECDTGCLPARMGHRTILRVSADHAISCLGCCWAFMLVLTAVGLMNLLAMALLTVLIFAERRVVAYGTAISRVAGGLLLLAAALAPFVSWLHPGVWGTSGMSM